MLGLVSDFDLFGNFPVAEPSHGRTSREVLQTHGPGQCAGEHCALHNPSAHALNEAPLVWRGDKGIMERTCRHGVGHPDPDSLDYLRGLGRDVEWLEVHGCDGCCR